MENKTVGPKEGLGAGIIGLGLLMLFLPGKAQEIADLGFIESEPFGILLGATLIVGLLVIGAGWTVIASKFDDD